MVLKKSDIPADEIAAYCRRWKISEFSIFGSLVFGTLKPGSDIDVLVVFDSDADWSYFAVVDMKDELEDLLGRRVDIVEEKSLRNPFRRRAILGTKETVYAAS